MQESGLAGIIPLIHISAIWGQYPVLSHPESPQGAPLEVAEVVERFEMGNRFVSTLYKQWVVGAAGGLVVTTFVC